MAERHHTSPIGASRFAARLSLVLKVLAISRGQLAALMQVDKSVVSRWLSGANVPTEHNLARLSSIVAQRIPSFTMLDWEAADSPFALRIGLSADAGVDDKDAAASVPNGETKAHFNFPLMERLPAIAASMHETIALGGRYCGLWRSWMPTVGLPQAFHCEHLLIREDGPWLSGEAVALSYRKPVVSLVANGQLILILSDANYYVTRLLNRADGPIIDQVDGLQLAAASLSHQAPTACRFLMQRILPAGASEEEMANRLKELEDERRILTADELPTGLAEFLIPSIGLEAAAAGGERLLRADVSKSLVETRWF